VHSPLWQREGAGVRMGIFHKAVSTRRVFFNESTCIEAKEERAVFLETRHSIQRIVPSRSRPGVSGRCTCLILMLLSQVRTSRMLDLMLCVCARVCFLFFFLSFFLSFFLLIQHGQWEIMVLVAKGCITDGVSRPDTD
jgi:hypothetical protein